MRQALSNFLEATGIATRASLNSVLAAREVLQPEGRFVAYQFRSDVRRMAEPLFGPADVRQEFRNVPPMRVYLWHKESPRA